MCFNWVKYGKKVIGIAADMFDSKQSDLRLLNNKGTTGWRRFLDLLCAGRSDYRTFQHRKAGGSYRRQRDLCRWLWILAGLLMVWQPYLQFMLVVTMIATFLSFALLDES